MKCFFKEVHHSLLGKSGTFTPDTSNLIMKGVYKLHKQSIIITKFERNRWSQIMRKMNIC
jgi:hypothetical protein